MIEPGLDRRTFVKRAAAVAGGATLVGAVPAIASQAAAAAGRSTSGPLTAAERGTLEALLGQLLPADEHGPGAVQAGVPTYIERALAGSYQPLASTYKAFLATLDRAARAAGSRSFRALSAAKQTKLLEEVEDGKAPGVNAAGRTAAQAAFALVLEHMREGMFGDPMYGGNRDLAGWELIGYPGIQLEVSEHVQAVDAQVPSTGMTAIKYGGKPYNGPPA